MLRRELSEGVVEGEFQGELFAGVVREACLDEQFRTIEWRVIAFDLLEVKVPDAFLGAGQGMGALPELCSPPTQRTGWEVASRG